MKQISKETIEEYYLLLVLLVIKKGHKGSNEIIEFLAKISNSSILLDETELTEFLDTQEQQEIVRSYHHNESEKFEKKYELLTKGELVLEEKIKQNGIAESTLNKLLFQK